MGARHVSSLAKNKKPQPETTPSRCPRAAALPLARHWTVRRHNRMGRYRGQHFKLRANSLNFKIPTIDQWIDTNSAIVKIWFFTAALPIASPT
jgi:hypothetical protein